MYPPRIQGPGLKYSVRALLPLYKEPWRSMMRPLSSVQGEALWRLGAITNRYSLPLSFHFALLRSSGLQTLLKGWLVQAYFSLFECSKLSTSIVLRYAHNPSTPSNLNYFTSTSDQLASSSMQPGLQPRLQRTNQYTDPASLW